MVVQIVIDVPKKGAMRRLEHISTPMIAIPEQNARAIR
jgi:hypothetical protein